MKRTTQLKIIGLTLGLGALVTLAQGYSGSGSGRGRGPGGQGGSGRSGMTSNPLFLVLDANRDGILSAREIDNASNALRRLDRNRDGQITPEELRPQRGSNPGYGQGQGQGQGQGRGQGRSSGARSH